MSIQNIVKQKRNFGWLPDRPDARDQRYESVRMPMELAALPSKVDLRTQFPAPCYDQGELGSCVSNAIAAKMQFLRLRQKLPTFMPSRLYIYYNARWVDGNVNEDAGTYIRTGIKVIAKAGFAHESIWKYDIKKFAIQPPVAAYEDARLYYPIKYFRLDNTNLNSLKNCLAAGYPIVFGFTMYDSFWEADTNGGIVPMPRNNEADIGGHCVLIIGYDDTKEQFIIRNSFGTKVGDKGHYYMPYEYLTNKDLAEDFWTVRLVSSEYTDKPLAW